jgi:hypothetical protein
MTGRLSGTGAARARVRKRSPPLTAEHAQGDAGPQQPLGPVQQVDHPQEGPPDLGVGRGGNV